MIDLQFKIACVNALQGMTPKEIYEKMFLPEYGNRWTLDTFKRKLRDWRRKALADENMLAAGTFPKFTAHDATVQIGSDGRITQVWVKQQQEKLDWISLKNFLAAGVKPSNVQPAILNGETMLEIPLFDLHFGIADLNTYKDSLSEILGIIESTDYDEINILFGQDVLHNNDMRGHTANGTDVQLVDFKKAWQDAWIFFCTLINYSLKHASRVKLSYSKGNHDECSAWCLFKTLEVAYPQCEFDDSLAPRKCIFWKGCFIGYGHCEYTSKSTVLFRNFVCEFAKEFAEATVREIHSGHLHRESVDDGICVRRLPSAVPTDKWSSDNGYVGAHKRFMLFQWAPGRLKAIYYV